MARAAWTLAIIYAAASHAADLPPVDALPERPDLPDPLVMLDGRPVETPEQWRNERRPELKTLFQHYVYGYMPEPARIEAREAAPPAAVLDGAATLQQVEISFPDLPPTAPRFNLALFTPSAPGPHPVILAMNKCGNQTVLPDEVILIPRRDWHHSGCAPDNQGARGYQTEYWSLDYLIARGYALATFHCDEAAPDRDGPPDGIRAYFHGLPGPPETHWGTLAAWAWSMHRAVDYLLQCAEIDPDRICALGHSRRGKATLLAAAFDERIAVAIPHQSGTGGMALSRNNDQETVERITRVFPHWFNGLFPAFGDNEARLPVDQHLLVALVAPRAVLDNGGLQDTWANFESAYRALRAASPVYEFLGAPGYVAPGPIEDDAPITAENAGSLLQYRLDARHVLNRDYWRAILDFADAQWAMRAAGE